MFIAVDEDDEFGQDLAGAEAKANMELIQHQNHPEVPPPIDCMVTKFSDWSSCNAVCGKKGWKEKVRMIKVRQINRINIRYGLANYLREGRVRGKNHSL